MVHALARAALVVAPLALCSLAGLPGSAAPNGVARSAATGQRAFELSARTAAGRTVTITQFTDGLPKSHSLGDITLGPDGSTLWFTDDIDPDFGADLVGRITPAGAVKLYAYNGSFAGLSGIASGPDGALWITDYGDDAIVRLSTAGKFTQYVLPGNPAPDGIAAGPDGALWFTENNYDEEAGYGIGRITTAGAITIYSKGIPAASRPVGITAGPDRALWFTENAANAIGRITTAGAVTTYTEGISPAAELGSITSGPDGALWFTEKNAIGRIATSGAVTEYRTGIPAGEVPTEIAAGADGALWFTEHGKAPAIGRITTAGGVTQYAQGITPRAFPLGIAAGAHDTIWFTESGKATIGKVSF